MQNASTPVDTVVTASPGEFVRCVSARPGAVRATWNEHFGGHDDHCICTKVLIDT